MTPYLIGHGTDESQTAAVGVRSSINGVSLQLPHGYEIELDAEEARIAAVEIYRMLFRFAEVCRRNGVTSDVYKNADIEGNITAPGGLDYRPSSDDELPHFSFRLITALRELFSLLRTPTLLTVQPQAAPCDAYFDWRQIEKHLHRAMYLPDGTPVFEAMDAPRPVLRDQSTDIIGMACWVARDAARHFLGEDMQSIAGSALAREWEALADDFSDRYLGGFSPLFSDGDGKTCRELRHVLLEIDRNTPFKSSRYLDLSELLEAILSYHVCGDGGDVWAMKGFAYAWEGLCLEHAIDEFNGKIFTCDDTYLDKTGVDSGTLKNWSTNRVEVFSRNARDRRPDLVIKVDNTYTVIDFKYYAELTISDLARPSHKNYEFNKFAQDLDNLEAYGFLIATASQSNLNHCQIEYEMWVPSSTPRTSSWELVSRNSKWCINIVQKSTRELVQNYGKKFRMWE